MQIILIMIIFVFGFFHIRNTYANILNKKGCNSTYIYDAENYLLQAIRLNPDNPLYYSNLGHIYAKEDSSLTIINYINGIQSSTLYLEKSISCFRKAVLLNSNDSDFCLNLGILYFMKGDIKEAKEFLEKAILLSPDKYKYISLGILYEYLFDRRSSAGMYIKAISDSPDIINSQFYLDYLCQDRILANEIVLSVEKHLFDEYTCFRSPILAAKLGKILKNKNPARAEVLLKKASIELPSMNRPWFYLGYLKEQQNDIKNATLYYNRSVLLDDCDKIHFNKIHKNKKNYPQDFILKGNNIVNHANFTLNGIIKKNIYNCYPFDNMIVIQSFENYLFPFFFDYQ